MKNKLIKICTLIIMSNAAHATYYGCDSTYLISANFSEKAYGKSVQAVAIHSGTLELINDASTGSQKKIWSGMSDIKMVKVGNHFFGKVETSGHSGGGTGAIVTKNLGPVIQYWITFVDGSSMISPAYSVNVNQSFGPAQASVIKDVITNFNQQTDADVTSSVEIYSGNGCSN
jgi:hypothetical protein